MSPGNLIRHCCPDLSHWSRTGRDSARPSQYPAKRGSGLGPLLPGHPSPVAPTAQFRDHPTRHVISGRILNGRVEIPIETAATLRPTSRGFLP